MALHSRWSSGDLIFYDGTQDIMTIKDNTDGIIFGEDDEGVDVKFWGETDNAYMLWDAGNDELVFDLADIAMGDTDYIMFGDDDDFTIACTTGDVLEILPAAANSDMYLGSTGYPLDVVNYGNVTYRDPLNVNSTSDITLTATDNRMQFIDSCGGDISLMLPIIAGCAGIEFKIYNTTGSGVINVTDTGSATVATLEKDDVGYFLCDGVIWASIVAGTST